MNDLQIDYFMAVATNLSFTKTSEELFVSQPAISRQISQLEKELGCRLFRRNNQGTELTEEGRLYFDLFSKYKAEFINTKLKAERITGKNKAVMRVGFLEGWDLFNIIPPMMERFKTEYPDTEVIINCCGVKELATGLLTDTLDLVVTIQNSVKLYNEFECIDAASIGKILLFAASHPLAQKDISGLTLKDFSNHESTITCVRNNMGVTIADDWVWAKNADDLRWIPFNAQDSISIARLKTRGSDDVLAMEEILLDILKNHKSA